MDLLRATEECCDRVHDVAAEAGPAGGDGQLPQGWARVVLPVLADALLAVRDVVGAFAARPMSLEDEAVQALACARLGVAAGAGELVNSVGSADEPRSEASLGRATDAAATITLLWRRLVQLGRWVERVDGEGDWHTLMTTLAAALEAGHALVERLLELNCQQQGVNARKLIEGNSRVHDARLALLWLSTTSWAAASREPEA